MKDYKSEFINGKYFTKCEAANLTGIAYEGYLFLIEKGISPQEVYDFGTIINTKPKTKKSELINGEYYTVKEAAKLVGITYAAYIGRRNRKDFTAQEIFDEEKLNGGIKEKKSEIINNNYYTVKEAAKLVGISINAYRSRKYAKGLTAQDIFNKEKSNSAQQAKKSELINGKYYTKVEAANLIGISAHTYRSRKRNGLTAQEAFDMKKYEKVKSKSQLINGKHYTIQEAATLIGIDIETYKKRLSRGRTPQEAYEMGGSEKNKKKSKKSQIINGTAYTRQEAANLIGISYEKYSRLNWLGKSAQEIYDENNN